MVTVDRSPPQSSGLIGASQDKELDRRIHGLLENLKREIPLLSGLQWHYDLDSTGEPSLYIEAIIHDDQTEELLKAPITTSLQIQDRIGAARPVYVSFRGASEDPNGEDD